VKLYRKAVLDVPTFLLFLVVFILAAFVGVSPAILVIVSGVFGLAFQALRKEGKK
jgi:chromate transport protein ChrA